MKLGVSLAAAPQGQVGETACTFALLTARENYLKGNRKRAHTSESGVLGTNMHPTHRNPMCLPYRREAGAASHRHCRFLQQMYSRHREETS